MKETKINFLCPVCGGQQEIDSTKSKLQCLRCGLGIDLPSMLPTVCPVCFYPLISSKEEIYPCSNPDCIGYYLDSDILQLENYTVFRICHTHIFIIGRIFDRKFITLKRNNLTGEFTTRDNGKVMNQFDMDDILSGTMLQSYSDKCFISKFLFKVASKLYERN